MTGSRILISRAKFFLSVLVLQSYITWVILWNCTLIRIITVNEKS